MIADRVSNASLYENLKPAFKTAFDFLKTDAFKNLPLGKHEIDGENLFVVVMEYESKNHDECKMEKHEKYIDIQCILEGEELIGVKTFSGQLPVISYDKDKDVAFFEDNYDSLLKVTKDDFAIFFTHDIHRPCMRTEKPSKVKKAVFKILTN